MKRYGMRLLAVLFASCLIGGCQNQEPASSSQRTTAAAPAGTGTTAYTAGPAGTTATGGSEGTAAPGKTDAAGKPGTRPKATKAVTQKPGVKPTDPAGPATNPVDTAEEEKPVNGVLTVKVKTYGAVGDGTTDDGRSVGDALQRAVDYSVANPQHKVVVEFEAGKAYSLQSLPIMTASSNACMLIAGGKNITLKGNGCTIIGNPSYTYFTVNGSENIRITGFNFDYAQPVAVTATVSARSGNTVDFTTPVDFTFSGSSYDFSKDSGTVFAIPANGGRDHSFFTHMTRLGAKKYRIAFTSGGYTIMDPGAKVYLPVPGYAYKGTAFQVLASAGVHIEDCHVYNAKEFIFQINNNGGDVSFQNVKIAPKNSSACATVGWRDAIHAKDNRGKLSFSGCDFRGTHDDIFNISNTLLEVTKTESTSDVYVKGLDYGPGGAFVPIKAGDTVTVFSTATGKLLGSTTIREVVWQNGGNIRLRLAKAVEGITAGVKLSIEDLASPGSTIQNCRFSGTYRIRGSTTVSNSTFDVLAMWTAFEGAPEGPIPHDITYRNCTFQRVRAGSGPVMTFVNQMDGGGRPSYALKNIVFEGCRFQDKGMYALPDSGVTIR